MKGGVGVMVVSHEGWGWYNGGLMLYAVEDAVIEFTVLVDEDSAPPLTSGKEKLEDILVLHLEKGKDFFIAVSGNYLPSCFGSSLETLVHLHTYIREVPVAKLVDLTSSWDECALEPRPPTKQTPPALDIPKELFAIIDFIERNGLDKVSCQPDKIPSLPPSLPEIS